jgi:succinate dehydrogenase / fumarate reductase cytochrome b subunit
MALSGLILVGFAIVHFVGNSTIFVGPGWLNSYAEHLRDLGPFVWVFRAFMLAAFGLHVFLGISLTLENWAANPGKYAVTKRVKTTFGSRTMIWTGLLLLVFIVFHLLHFTIGGIPGTLHISDDQGRPDVYAMVVAGLLNKAYAGIYLVAMLVLFLHLSHGIQSLFQSVGLSNDRTLPKYTLMGKGVSLLLLLGYCAIPALILAWVIN